MSISDIREKYNIESTELEDVKYELKQLLKKTHPDNNNGEYDTDYFESLKNDFEFVENEIIQKNSEKQEVKILSDVIADIIQNTYLNNGICVTNESERLEEKLEHAIEKYSPPIKVKTRMSRYSLASITAVITFLWLLPEKIMTHPIFSNVFWRLDTKEYASFSKTFLAIWLEFLLITILYWRKAFKIEQIEKEVLRQVKLKSIQNNILMSFLKNLEYRKEKNFARESFVKHIRGEVVNMLIDMFQMKSGRRRMKLRMNLQSDISEEIIQNIADIILQNAEEHKIICKIEKRSLMEYYSVIID